MRGNLTLDYQPPGFVSGPALDKKISDEEREALDIMEIYAWHIFSSDDDIGASSRHVYMTSAISLYEPKEGGIVKYARDLVRDVGENVPGLHKYLESTPPEKGEFDDVNRARLQRIADERGEPIMTQFGEIRPSNSLVFDGSGYLERTPSNQLLTLTSVDDVSI